MKKYVLAGAAILACATLGSGKAEATTYSYTVVATNDLGMHCVCMTFDKFVLLPPFNTLRAQVIRKGSDPSVMASPTSIRVEYSIVEDTKATLDADPYYQNWVTYAPKLFPTSQGYLPPKDASGNYQSPFTGAKLSGQMTAHSTEGWWEVKGVPAYPVIDSNGIMIDPLGGPNRNPYLTASVKAYDQATNTLLAQTTTVVPAGFGGCCSCHIQVAQNYGFPATPEGSFEAMGYLHQRDNGINIAQIDPDGDGIMGPIRCSQCHLDPAMGESTPPGYAGYPTSQYTFSDVLHRFHVQSQAVQTMDPNIATDCYKCHPGNGVNCYRGTHKTKTIGSHAIWCSDCHGDLNQRVAQNQMAYPWSDKTLPQCATCHGTTWGEGGGYLNTGIFGKYLNSRGHEDHQILCSTCHGEPHGLYPSTLAKDNQEMINLQNSSLPLGGGSCNACHTDRNYGGTPPH
ncbi:MAG: hypothetical protein M0017_05955 [Desulfobacteraceae bacterium]|nr:hypothetical protein [Desulfobacteraceae bacterium]